MKIQINTDKNIEGHERLETYFSGELEKGLARFEEKITRIEVHFGDENGEKFSLNDKKCLIEVRIANLQPITVTEHSDTIEKAFSGALAKIKKSLTTTFEKMKEY
ncbi:MULTISPECIES: HPF/RaiA family ribosome-associated protein [Flavobacterium]|uniref:HPF/RaiA family ribosome-associated protein n=2 Tax=Flavobacterium TaxID=237 RepID=A0A940XAF9_9FLAO|nr:MULTISPECIES: HPF/RaiA family ribosome-associated protein [Flavobacterium]MBP4138767.1 HPF/RaiA family ribosome-associated protein [Flavobacterium geliluteum]MDX6181240.1 HPF/RaiA family ribosome-associated protein [Flavobacterium sp. Fl-33]MDX6184841.1 HPF/RaiA family ribosome-associated protein [Flavobacterium sp. Fl-77]UFH39934.1 HPF/RaiA family ribosome-associated protein [Flavobacterium sp. F-70]